MSVINSELQRTSFDLQSALEDDGIFVKRNTAYSEKKNHLSKNI